MMVTSICRTLIFPSYFSPYSHISLLVGSPLICMSRVGYSTRFLAVGIDSIYKFFDSITGICLPHAFYHVLCRLCMAWKFGGLQVYLWVCYTSVYLVVLFSKVMPAFFLLTGRYQGRQVMSSRLGKRICLVHSIDSFR